MSSDAADTLVRFVVKSIGKREFLKSVDRLFPKSKSSSKAAKVEHTPVQTDKQCEARVKGERTGIKAGRYVLFDAQRCPRARVEGGQLCCIHENQVKKEKFHLGYVNAPLTDAQKKVFGELD